MPAKDHLSPKQLKMFMTGQEIINDVTFSHDTFHGAGESLEDTWRRKEQEGRQPGLHPGSSLYDSMLKHGYKQDSPVLNLHQDNEGEVFLADGHHRVATAAALEREGKRQIFFPINNVPPFNPEDWDNEFLSS